MTFIITKTQGKIIDSLFMGGMLGAGLFAQNPKQFYILAVKIFIYVSLGMLTSQLFILSCGKLFGKKIQDEESTKPPKYFKEIIVQHQCYLCVALLFAWPYMKYINGDINPYVLNLKDSVVGDSILYNTIQIVLLVFFLDTYTYFKHYLFHTPAFHCFHEVHHQFSNPSVFGCFAIGPVESFFTFCLVLLQAHPICEIAKLFFPVQVGVIVFFAVLNTYLHSGYTFDLIENTLPYLLINTSAFHNKHHQVTVSHIGEVGIIWDLILNTGPTVYSQQRFENKKHLLKKLRLEKQHQKST